MQNQNGVLIQQVALTMADDSCRIMSFVVDDGRGIQQAATEESINEAIRKASESWVQADPHVVPVKSWRLINNYVPVDSRYHGARKDNGKAIVYDKKKAVDAHLEVLRKERIPLLESLDIEYTKAQGQNKKATADAIEAKRQALRDAPTTLLPKLEAASTIEQIMAVKLPET